MTRGTRAPGGAARPPHRLITAAILVHDLGLSVLAVLAALWLRYRLADEPAPVALLGPVAPAVLIICLFVYPVFRLHRGLWRFTAANDLLRIAAAVAVVNLLLLLLLFLADRLIGVPRSTPLIAGPLMFAGLAFGRLAREAVASGGLARALTFEDKTRPSAVVLADPPAAARYLRSAPGQRLRVVGVVCVRERANVGRTLQGAEILGDLSRLPDILRAVKAAEGRPLQVVLAETPASRELLDAAIAAASEAGAQVTVPGRDLAAPPHPVQPADLLERPPKRLDPGGPRRLLAGKVVLVTGAGGTIGGELTRQVLGFAPRKVILLDASEYNLYAIDRELSETRPVRNWSVELGDVRDRRRLQSLFEAEAPDVVLHAAALKHVPLMELNPCEAVLTNVLGAVNVAEAARGAESLVFISTDKAVNPTNVMGATKRVAEQAVQAIARGHRVAAATVRFGNVLGSTGSVVPLFERQIKAGGPVTVTDPAIERYFMTVEEAAALVLQAASLPQEAAGGGEGPRSGPIYVLDMGEPVRIDELARQMIRLHGLRPDEDIKILYSGLRPGEKLYEEIFYGAETVRQTPVDGVLAAAEALPSWEELEGLVVALARAAEARDEAETLRLLKVLVPPFRRE